MPEYQAIKNSNKNTPTKSSEPSENLLGNIDPSFTSIVISIALKKYREQDEQTSHNVMWKDSERLVLFKNFETWNN